MHWTLCRTACTCAWRAACAALRSHPLVGALVAPALVALPLLAATAGDAAAPVLDTASSDARLANALSVALIAACATVGVAIAMLAPDRGLLGRQLEPAPLRAGEAFVGLTLLPFVAFAAPVLAIAAPFALAASGGTGSAAALLAGAGSGVMLGAAAAASLMSAWRGSAAAAAGAALVVAVWATVGWAAGDPRLGPAAALAASVRDVGSSLGPLVAANVAAVAVWALAVARQPRARSRRRDVRVLVVRAARGPYVAAALATTARLLRNASARRHFVAGAAFALAGALGVRLVVGEGAAPYFAAFVALLVAAACPLIASGLRRDAHWLLRVAPASPRRLTAADAGASVVVGFVVVAVLLLAGTPVGLLGSGDLLIVEVNAALVLGAAAASSALVPWRDDRTLEQLASYAVLAVVAVLLTAALGRASDVASEIGVSQTTFAAVAAHVVLVGGVAFAAVLAE